MKKSAVRACSLCLVGLLMADPLYVEANNGTGLITTVTPSAGAASLYTLDFTTEECLKAAAEAQGAFWGYTNIGIADVESGNLNVRETPNTSGKLVGKMPRGSACEVLDTADGWAHIISGEVEGYVSLDYLSTGADAKMKAKNLVTTVVIINVDALKVRDEASLEGAVLTQVPLNEELDYVADAGEWVEVSIDGENAFVFAEYVTVEEKLSTAITMSELLYGQGVSDLRVDIAEYAKQFVGNPYVWGGTSLTKGADCSGFVLAVYKKFGISISHSSRAQANEGTKITASQLQPGDLVFYANSTGTINHVSMYIGGGRVIHASSPKTGIKISKYNYRTPVKYVSIIQE